MAFKWSAIECFEVHNTRREWFDGEGRFYAQVRLQCDWNNRFLLVQDLYTCSADGNGTPIGYYPRAYPGGDSTATGGSIDAPDMTRVGVMSASIASWSENYLARAGSSDQVMDYKSSAFIDVQYGTHYNIEETIEFDSELITQSYLDFIWQSKAGDKDLRYVHELEVPVAKHYDAILTREFKGLAPKAIGTNVLKPDFATLQECVGYTNHKAYTSPQLGMTFKKGTLMMMEPIVKPSVDMQNVASGNLNNFGGKGFSVTVRFLHKKGVKKAPQAQSDTTEETHNLFWRPRMHKADAVSKGGWDRLLIKVEGESEIYFELYEPFENRAEIWDHWLFPATPPTPAT